MTGENDNRKKEAKGFAGLSDLVPDIDATPPPVARSEPGVVAGGMPPPTKAASSPPPVKPPNQNRPRPVAPPPSSDSSAGKWVLGIALVFGVLWLIGQADKKPSSRSAGTPGAATQAPTRPEESKPPIGQDLVFSTAQIRYCLAEDIRMDAAKSVLNNYSDADVDQFNAMVSDYNSRCGSFRYRSGALESARRDIEPYRSQLQTEGRSRFARSLPSTSLPASAPSRPAPDATVLAIQQKLNELGYDAGTVDGLMGRGTRSAILAFQRANRLPQTGVASADLLLKLQQAPPRSVASPTELRQPIELSQLSPEEKSSLESACSTDKHLNGPSAYRACVERQLAALEAGVRRPSLGNLSRAEQQSIESACSSDKYLNGPAAYNRCLQSQLASMSAAGSHRPNLSGLSRDELQSIESVCSSDKYLNGPAAYNRCLENQSAALSQQGGGPDLSGLSSADRRAVESACSSDKYLNGPAAYNRCLSKQMAGLR